MAADKYDFIQEVLASKTITSVQREKLLLLTSAEIQKDKKFNLGRAGKKFRKNNRK